MKNLKTQSEKNESSVSYSNIMEIISTRLPDAEAALLKRFKKCYSEGYFEEVIEKKVEEIEDGKYGILGDEDFYCPNSGYYEETDAFRFNLGDDFFLYVETLDHRKDDCCEDPIMDGGTYIGCSLQRDADDEWEEEEIPDYIKALLFEEHFPYECFEEALDTLFREIEKCKEKYLKKV